MMSNISEVSVIKQSAKGMVYLAFDNDAGQPVIVKKINGIDATEMYSRLQSIDSPLITNILSIEYKDDCTTVVEEYISGKTLDIIISEAEEKLISAEYFRNYIFELLDVLEVLHGQNPPIIHRDIKPENIIITDDNHLRLTDFDAARVYKTDSDTDTVLLGTRGYVAPEQYGYAQTDTRSDIYSIGVVMKDMLVAFDLSALSKKERKHLDEIINKCCMFAPKDRYADVNALRADLLQVFPTAVSKKIKRKVTAIKILLAAMIVCAIVSITCGIIALISYNKTNEAYLPNFPDAFVVKTDDTYGVELVFDKSDPKDVFVINKYFDSPAFGIDIYSEKGVNVPILFEDMYAYDNYIGIRKEFLATLDPGTYTVYYNMFDYDYVAIYDLKIK